MQNINIHPNIIPHNQPQIEEVGSAGDLPAMVKRISLADWTALQKIAKRRMKVYESRKAAGVGQFSFAGVACLLAVFAVIALVAQQLLKLDAKSREYKGPKIKHTEKDKSPKKKQ